MDDGSAIPQNLMEIEGEIYVAELAPVQGQAPVADNNGDEESTVSMDLDEFPAVRIGNPPPPDVRRPQAYGVGCTGEPLDLGFSNRAPVHTTQTNRQPAAPRDERLTRAKRKAEKQAQLEMYKKQKKERDEQGPSEFFGGLNTHKDWNENRLRVGYQPLAEARLRNIGADPNVDYGFDGDDVKRELNTPLIRKTKSRKWEKIAKTLMTKEKLKEIKKSGRPGDVVKQILRKKYPEAYHPKQFPPEETVKEKWGFNMDDIREKIEEEKRTNGKPPSFRRLAMVLGKSPGIGTRTNGGDLVKEYMLRRGGAELVKQLERQRCPVPKIRNARRRPKVIAPYNIPVVIDKSSRTIQREWQEKLKKEEDLREEIFGEAIPQEFTIRRVSRKHGEEGEVIIVDKHVNARYKKESSMYTKHLKNLDEQGLLKPVEGIKTIFIRHWYDGSLCGALPLVRVKSNFMWDESLFQIPRKSTHEEALAFVCKHHEVMIWPGSETRETWEKIGEKMVEDWLEWERTVKIGSNEYQFRPSIQVADTKGAQSLCGSQNGGHYACPLCLIHRTRLHSMILGVNTKVRTVQMTRLNNAAPRKKGQKGLPIWILGVPKPERRNFIQGIYRRCELGMCTLHIIEGHSLLLYTELRNLVLEDKREEFDQTIKNLTRKEPALRSNMYASDWRALWCLYKWIFKPEFFDSDEYPLILDVVSTFCMLNWHFYSRYGERDQRSVLRVHTLIIKHHLSIQKLFPVKEYHIYKSHYHQLVAHLALKYRRYPLFSLNSELEEMGWKSTRTIETKHSNHKDNQTENILNMSYFKEIRDAGCLKSSPALSIIKQTEHVHQDLVFSKEEAATEDFGWFLRQIRDYEENTWFRIEEDGSWVFFTGEHHPKPTGPIPKVYNYSECTEDEMLQDIENNYQARKDVTYRSVQIIDALETPDLEEDYECFTADELKEEIRRRNADPNQTYHITQSRDGKTTKATMIENLREADAREGGINLCLDVAEEPEEEEESWMDEAPLDAPIPSSPGTGGLVSTVSDATPSGPAATPSDLIQPRIGTATSGLQVGPPVGELRSAILQFNSSNRVALTGVQQVLVARKKILLLAALDNQDVLPEVIQYELLLQLSLTWEQLLDGICLPLCKHIKFIHQTKTIEMCGGSISFETFARLIPDEEDPKSSNQVTVTNEFQDGEMAPLGLCIDHPIIGDGNCFYRCLSKRLFGDEKKWSFFKKLIIGALSTEKKWGDAYLKHHYCTSALAEPPMVHVASSLLNLDIYFCCFLHHSTYAVGASRDQDLWPSNNRFKVYKSHQESPAEIYILNAVSHHHSLLLPFKKDMEHIVVVEAQSTYQVPVVPSVVSSAPHAAPVGSPLQRPTPRAAPVPTPHVRTIIDVSRPYNQGITYHPSYVRPVGQLQSMSHQIINPNNFYNQQQIHQQAAPSMILYPIRSLNTNNFS